MGWLHKPWFSRKDWIEELNAPYQGAGFTITTLKKCLRGNVLWSVRERVWDEGRKSARWIGCDLLRDGGASDGWGYKDLTEDDGPYYLTCPLSYLDVVPESNPMWRGWVREAHAKKLAARRAARAI
jgi:hypothetical protein